METEESDTLAERGRDVPANGSGREGEEGTQGSQIGAINEAFHIDCIHPIHPVDDVSVVTSPGKTLAGEDKIGAINGTSHTGGIKIGINKKDYDLYISQLKDKGAKDVPKNNGGRMRRSSSGGRNNECDSDYYDMKHLDGNSIHFFDDGDASNKRKINTIISRMDSELTNTEDALSKINDNSTTYMSNENNICLLNNEADITDPSNFNPNFEFHQMMSPTDKTTDVENCHHVNFFKNRETNEVGFKNGGYKAGEQSAFFHEGGTDNGSHNIPERDSQNVPEHRRDNLVKEVLISEVNNPMPLNIAQPFGGKEQKSEENKLSTRVNPSFCDQTQLSKVQDVVHSAYAFLHNEEITTRLSTFCNKIQNDGEATSGGGGPPYQFESQVTIESEVNHLNKTALLANAQLYEQKGAHPSDLLGGRTTQSEDNPRGDNFYIERASEQEEENGEGSELSSHLRGETTRKKKKNDEEELRNDSNDKKILFREREQNNVDVSSDYHHLYDETHKDITEGCLRVSDGERKDLSSGCSIRRTSSSSSSSNERGSGNHSSNHSNNVPCSIGETLPSNVPLNSGGEKDAEKYGGQERTPPQEVEQTDDMYEETLVEVKKMGRRVGRKSKNGANKSGQSNGDAKGRGRIGFRPSHDCDVDATADCAAEADDMDDPTRDDSKHNGEEEESNGNDRGRAKHGSTNETYARRPLRNAAKKCIHLWSEELKKKSEKHNAALERSKNMGDQRKEERTLRRKDKVIKNGSKVITRGGLARGFGGRGWARGEAKRETKFSQDDANASDPAEEQESEQAQYDQEEEAEEEGGDGANGKAYCEEEQEGTHRRARGRPAQRTGNHTDPKVRERNQRNEAYESGEMKSEQLTNDTNERATKGGRQKNQVASLGQEQENIPILFNDSMDEREMFKYLDLLRHLPSKKGGAQYKLHKAILTEEMVRRAKKFPLVQGVYFDRYQQRWSVNWNEDGKRVAKYFPIKLFGFDYARRLAIYCKNYQKIPEEALLFEQAYRASQQSNKQRNDHSEIVSGGGAAGGVTEIGSGNASRNATPNGSINGAKLRRGGPKKVYKKRGLRKQDNSNEDKFSRGYGKRRKNINYQSGGDVDITMNEGVGENESGNHGPGQSPFASNYPLCSNYSGSAVSGVSSGANSDPISSERRDSSYRSDGGAKEIERSALPKVAPYFPSGSLPGSQGLGVKNTGGENHPYNQHNENYQNYQHNLHSIWEGLGRLIAPSAANDDGVNKQCVQGYLFEGDFPGGGSAKHGHLASSHPNSSNPSSGLLNSVLPNGAPFGSTLNKPGEGSNSANPSTGHMKEEQKNITGMDTSADRTDAENMMLMKQRMIMLEQGRAANGKIYMPFGSATMGLPITHSSNEMRRFGSGESHFDEEKKSSCMHNVVDPVAGVNSGNLLPMSTHLNHRSGVIHAVENSRELSSNTLPHMMIGENSTVESEEKKRGRKKGEEKKNHLVCTSTGTSSFKSSASHISSTSSCCKNMEMYLSSNGPLHDMGDSHKWRKGDATEDAADAADVVDSANEGDLADAAHPSSYNDETGNYYTTKEEEKKKDAPTTQGVHEDKLSRADLMTQRDDGNSDRCYLQGGRGPLEGKEENDDVEDEDNDGENDAEADEGEVNPDECVPRGGGIATNVDPSMERHIIGHAVRNIIPKEENIHKGAITHLNSGDGVSQVAGDDTAGDICPHSVISSTVERGQNATQIENDGNKLEDILNINKYSEIVNRLDNYTLMSKMSQGGVKVEGGLIPLGGLNFKRENTDGASKDSIREEVNHGEEVPTGGVSLGADIIHRGGVPNEDVLLNEEVVPNEDGINGGDLTQENNEDDINSRIVGVHYDRKQYRWKATWYTSHGRRCAKYYPIKQYGYLEAKKMAIECRRAYNAYKKLKKDPENGIEEGEFNFDSIIFPKEYYVTLFENDEKKDGYFWNPKKNKKTGKNPFLDNNEKQRRHYNEALKKITNIKCKDLSQLNEFMVRKNDGEASTYPFMGVAVDPSESSNVFAPPKHQQEEEEDYSGAHFETAGMMGAYQGGIHPSGSYQGGVFQSGSYQSGSFQGSAALPLAMTAPSEDSTVAMPVTNVDGSNHPNLENEQNKEWSTLQGVYNQGGIFQDSCCNVMSGEGQHVTSNGCSAHVQGNACPVHVPENGCSSQNVSSLLSLYYLSENILKFQKGTIKCILQDLRDNCLSNLAYDIKNITFQEYYMAIHYLNRYVENSNCYDDIFFLLKILAKNLEIRKIPSLYNEEEQKELLNSLTVITKQMKNGYSYFTPDTVKSASEGGEAPCDRFSSVIFH
ncbi:hypothetical protein C922_01308 [Plasmodium inui San Antonio 1]|uniref:AP2/ERF domain-containing protein n=1 Tax=Plasmodium inui San Antonio 1 TaxID=1237626 RepID=W7AAI5_9APIC|nr:hypothetical protein C922_01308 [Plasmodium inui San Antonio 1]EUD68288.1 hypothetical protein C922_01308 [Plasmodium inui San Antonio 1]